MIKKNTFQKLNFFKIKNLLYSNLFTKHDLERLKTIIKYKNTKQNAENCVDHGSLDVVFL